MYFELSNITFSTYFLKFFRGIDLIGIRNLIISDIDDKLFEDMIHIIGICEYE